MIKVAALFVQTDGAYFGLPDVDPWDIHRDARKYAGPYPAVAHPPCSSWCQLAHVNQKRWGRRVGDDGGCFASALASVRKWGGVIEHPAESYAWPAFGLIRPTRHGWTQDITDGSWSCEVSQAAYGHRARKLTWLYYVGSAPPCSLDWSRQKASHRIGHRRDGSPLPTLSKHEASATPPLFRAVLLELALLSLGVNRQTRCGNSSQLT